MSEFGSYPKKVFSTSQNFLARDPANSGQVIRVNGQSILDAAVQEIRDEGGLVLGIDTKTEALATDIGVGVYVLTGGDAILFDGGGGVYRVSDLGSGGDSMANGNELVSIVDIAQIEANEAQIQTNKQSYTATFSSNTYTVTPEINPTVWPTLQAGLIIEFDLSTTANTSTVNIDFNGTTDELKWINGDSLASGDLDGDYTTRIRCRFDGTDWLIISDVSGSNANGDWEKKADGWQFCTYLRSHSSLDVNTANGSVFISAAQSGSNYPKSYSSIPATSLQIQTATNNIAWVTSYTVSVSTSSWQGYYIADSITSTGNDFTVAHKAAGRWY